jgi:ZIP family zinc transporter
MELSPLTEALLLASLAGLTIPLGGLLATVERIRPHWLEEEFRHSVIAFGGGALLAAVALVLVPDGSRHLDITATLFCFLAGGGLVMVLDRIAALNAGPVSQLLAMLLDFAPEALALGASLTMGGDTALLLAGLIALQNLPEGFNAFREIRDGTGLGASRLLPFFLLLALVGPLCAGLGAWLLADAPQWLGGIMLAAAGGILYLTFQDIAPQARLQRHWAPPLGAVAGFALGLAGHLLIQ